MKRTLPIFLVALLLSAQVGVAHHGNTGIYDFSRPIYVEGEVVATEYAYPHAHIDLVIDGDLTLPAPEELQEYNRVEMAEGRSTFSMLQLPQMERVEVSFDGAFTRILLGEEGRPQVGDRVVAILYERVSEDEYQGEFRAGMVTMPTGRYLVLGRKSYLR